MATTRLGNIGVPQKPYGDFSGRAAPPPPAITRLGCYGGPRPTYGSFAGKAPAVPPDITAVPLGHHRLDNQYAAIAASRLNGVLQ